MAHAFGLLLHGASGETATSIADILGYCKFVIIANSLPKNYGGKEQPSVPES